MPSHRGLDYMVSEEANPLSLLFSPGDKVCTLRQSRELTCLGSSRETSSPRSRHSDCGRSLVAFREGQAKLPSTSLVLLLNPNNLRAEIHGPCVTQNPVAPFSNAFEPTMFS